MEQLKQIIGSLLSDSNNAQHYLQKLNETILKEYKIVFKNYLSIIPLEVEISYANFKCTPQFIDASMHCITTNGYRIVGTNELWKLQSNRFGKLYFHLKGAEGIDLCLSDSRDYALCMNIKGAKINDEEIMGKTKVAQRIMQIINEYERITEKNDIADFINYTNQEQYIVKNENHPQIDCVYHTKRKLRNYDKNSHFLLHSFIDVWNKKIALTNPQRLNLYMAAHPNEDVLEVMRKQKFRFIPTDIRTKYNLSYKVRL